MKSKMGTESSIPEKEEGVDCHEDYITPSNNRRQTFMDSSKSHCCYLVLQYYPETKTYDISVYSESSPTPHPGKETIQIVLAKAKADTFYGAEKLARQKFIKKIDK